MYIFVIPAGFFLWYLAYESKPTIDDEDANIWEKENLIKRDKIQLILRKNC